MPSGLDHLQEHNEPEKKRASVPDSVLVDMRNGSICIILSITLAILMFMLVEHELSDSLRFWFYVEIIFMFIGLIGTILKSRIATTSIFVYFISSKIYLIANQSLNQMITIIIALGFGYFLFRSMQASFSYHSIRNSSEYKSL